MQGNLCKIWESSQIWDTYLYGESIRSKIRTFKPLARISSVSADGDTVPFAMRLIVDLDMPVIIETCRVDRFLLSMILSSNIFILQL